MPSPEHQIYLDYAATTPLREEVLEAMLPYLREHHGNPSSVHRAGRIARQAVDHARESLASLINADPRDIIFTSGGTEANNLALFGVVLAEDMKDANIVVSAVEHPSVLNAARFLEKHHGVECRIAPVDTEGRTSLDAVRNVADAMTRLVAVMHANNETGALQPVHEIGAWCREKGIHFHCDAVQSLGKVRIDLAEFPADSISFSAHKIYGPKGIGALYFRREAKLLPRAIGGHQERGRRGGTESVANIVGFGAAAQFAAQDFDAEVKRLCYLRDLLETGLLAAVPGTWRNGPERERVPSISNISFPMHEGEEVLYYLDSLGVCVSTGSACSSGDLDASHVLLAMGQKNSKARRAVRFSVGRGVDDNDIKGVINAIAAWMNPDGDLNCR